MKVCKIEDCEAKPVGRGYCNKHYKRLMLKGSAEWERPTASDLFWTHVDKTDSCWNWTASMYPNGYGKSWDGQKVGYAHRIVLEMGGMNLSGLEVDHVCHNRRCVNPAHLVPGNRKANAENHNGPHRDNKSGHRGVCWAPRRNKWRAQVRHNGEYVLDEHFEDLLEAAEAAAEARRKWHRNNYVDRI